jgi:hypothetical protein
MLLLVGKGATMEKWMSLGSIVVAAIMLLVFLADLIAGVPFSGSTPQGKESPFMLVDIGGIIASLVVGYLGYNAFRDSKR